jgi:uncharacterized protein (DUF1501 family)
MQRRQLLHAASAGAMALSGHARLFAAAPDAPRLLLVFLRGGYDAASLLVPSSSSFYREVRPNIAIPAASAGVKGAISLNAEWGLHPALENSVLPLVHAGQAAFVPFAGTDDVSRSHFETQDTIELGQGLGAKRDFGSGFMNRLVGVMGKPAAAREAIAFTDQLPLVLRGALSVVNLSLKSEPKPADAKLRQALTEMYRNHPLQARVAESFDVREEAAKDMAKDMAKDGAKDGAKEAAAPAVAAASSAPAMASSMAPPAMAGEMVAANRNAINAKGFELEARRIARLMRERYALGFVDVGGWDTHVGQGAATGYLASRLEELGRGLAGFANEMGEAAWRNTVVVVVSEFGRTLRENGNRGTDHGHGSVYWVLGGSLRSASVVGEQQMIEAKTLFQNRDLPVLNDYRALLGGLLARQFALSPAQLQTVFPGAKPRDWGLV